MAAPVFRTPDERFLGLPGFEFEPAYRQVGDLRLAHVDVGKGPPVLFIHGSPLWSFVWRKVVARLAGAGYRCIAPDHAGYGRSDKPLDPGWYSVERHVELTGSILDDLDLRDVTIVVHDWGGPIGLSLALMRPERISRIVILDTAIDPRETWMNETWVRLREFIRETSDVPVRELMGTVMAHEPEEDVVRAYEAPFPTPESSAAIWGMMSTVPPAGDPAGAAAADRFYEALRRDPRPMLSLWGASDPFLT
ncbi:MAG TPA: alpha/beta fold hydrolase, partial [Thermoleophilaceae bacterium]